MATRWRRQRAVSDRIRKRNANRAWKRLESDSVDQVLAVPFGAGTSS